MELREGYKQTEVGGIPDDWEFVPLRELLTFKNGLNKAKEFFGKGTPIVNYMDVYGFAGLKRKNVKGKVKVTSEEKVNYSARKGDVFFTRTSETVDEIGISTVLLEEIGSTVFSGFVLRGRPLSERLDLHFKKYCFSSEIVRKQIRETSSYTTRALTNGTNLSKVLLPLPPTKIEQTAIANALSDADAWIQSLTRLIAKKRQIKQGAMQALLNPYESERLKSGWVVRKLGETTDYIGSGKTNTKNSSDGYPLYGSTGIIGACGDAEYSGDAILVARVGANAGILRSVSGEYGVSDNTIILMFKKIFHIRFMEYLLVESNLNKLVFGSGQPLITGSQLFSLEIILPKSIHEQSHIATILSDIDNEITALETKLAKAQTIKQGMMQNLLTGRIRLI